MKHNPPGNSYTLVFHVDIHMYPKCHITLFQLRKHVERAPTIMAHISRTLDIRPLSIKSGLANLPSTSAPAMCANLGEQTQNYGTKKHTYAAAILSRPIEIW